MDQVIKMGPSFLRREIGKRCTAEQGVVNVTVNEAGFARVTVKTERITMLSVFYAGTIERAWMIINLSFNEEV